MERKQSATPRMHLKAEMSSCRRNWMWPKASGKPHKRDWKSARSWSVWNSFLRSNNHRTASLRSCGSKTRQNFESAGRDLRFWSMMVDQGTCMVGSCSWIHLRRGAGTACQVRSVHTSTGSSGTHSSVGWEGRVVGSDAGMKSGKLGSGDTVAPGGAGCSDTKRSSRHTASSSSPSEEHSDGGGGTAGVHTSREQAKMVSRGTESSVETFRRDMCVEPCCAGPLTGRSSCPEQEGGPLGPRLRVQGCSGLQGASGAG